MMYTEDKLTKIENEIRNDMKKEKDLEVYVVDEARTIASELISRNCVRLDVKGTEYEFKYMVVPMPMLGKDRKFVALTATNCFKAKMLPEKYKPYKLHAEMDTDYDLQANLSSVVEAFLRYDLDVIKPGILEE